ncbi:lysozyme inhibitor LprI family protein [Vibrio lentus]|uniref:lysozyme inhibitor LprI family protein n=1 Tax=Vibrio lentus TaxID=136468 RepID=UPI000C84B322|nr:lysozyme inhibitor LprI family protein [Vibrio lentus]PMG25000.1 hypothetical protein BCU96_05910 [Vibrio lentus]PMH09193.1 hypothetical protein BCU76_07550 [Vibrio lentus]PMI42453.1 hypothetical protein BCU45_18215 [Vibrio lentus]PMI65078.1 hypothetical protein BCU40_19230 [Vibrio lentus]PMJ15006.1 hypothetical protein BCU30_03995 [Vibrio lentus]
MNKKIIISIFVFLFSSASVFACSSLGSSSELLDCKKREEEESRSQMQETYSLLYEYLSDATHYQKEVKLSQKLWLESAVKNCDIYAYFAEDGSIAHNVASSECMSYEYKSRYKFLIKTKKVAEEFF